MTTLKYACIGAGAISGKKHLPGYQKVPGVALTAICDINTAAAERMAARYAIPAVYQDYHRMLADVRPEVVSVCTTNDLHAQMTVACLEAGANVHLEKPVALNAAEAERIVAAEKRTGRQVMVALNNRFTPESAYVAQCVAEGFFGEIYHAKCGWKRRNGIPGKGVWFTDKSRAGGGPLIDLGVHYLDLVLHFMGYPTVTRVSGTTWRKLADQDHRLRPGYKNMGDGLFNVEDMAVGTLNTLDHAQIMFEFSWASNIEKETKYYELIGTRGGARWCDGELRLFTESGKTGITISPDLSLAPPVETEYAQFVSALRNGTAVPATATQGLAMMRIIDAIYRSSEADREIRLEA